jgi:hypothetical protein
LYAQGYRGNLYAGYRGELPLWANLAEKNTDLGIDNCKTMKLGDGLILHLLALSTDYHLTNFKPDFMMQLWDGPEKNTDNLYYFDPDIIVVRPWDLFEEWTNCGVAVSEDINSPLSEFNPRRVAWRRYFGEKGIELRFKDSIYVNAGFIGLNKKDRNFLELWKKVQETLSPLIGGLNRSIFTNEHLSMLDKVGGPFSPFVKTDQDALNAAIEATDKNISFLGKDGMGFEGGMIIMYHAIGFDKPWQWNPFRQMLRGMPPRKVDIEYSNSLEGPIPIAVKSEIFFRKISLKFCTAIGRFYQRN